MEYYGNQHASAGSGGGDGRGSRDPGAGGAGPGIGTSVGVQDRGPTSHSLEVLGMPRLGGRTVASTSATSYSPSGIGPERSAEAASPSGGGATARIVTGDSLPGGMSGGVEAEDDDTAVYVDHTYTDYASIAPAKILADYTEPTNTGGISQPFPQRLHALLSTPSLYDPSVVGWQEHGRCFMIRKPKEFANTTMATHFKHGQFTSFQRQLNLYGFKRITTGRDKGAYYHGEFRSEIGKQAILCCL